MKREGKHIFIYIYKLNICRNIFYLIEVQDPTGGPDRVEDSVVDDGVHGESDAVRGEDLLGRNLIHSSSRVDTTNL